MKVSVCIMTYNHAKYITQAIESVLAQQTTFDFEIIIGEDQSTDGTRDIVLSYKDMYPTIIKVFLHDYPANYIRVNGRNNLVNNLINASGDYIAWLDGDDYWTDPQKLHKQINFLDANPFFSTVFHWADWLENGMIQAKVYGPPLVKDRYTVDDLLEHSNFIPSCSAMFRRSLITRFPEWYFQCPFGDLPLHIMNALQGEIGFIDSSMAVYRLHKGGLYTNRSEINKQLNNLYAFELIAANLGLQHRPSFKAYTDNRIRDIRFLIDDVAVLREAETIIDAIDTKSGSFIKIDNIKAEIKNKLGKSWP